MIYRVHKVIKFDQNAWLKQYTDINTDLRKKAKNNFEKFFKLMNAVFGKTMKNVKNIDILNLSSSKEEGIIQYYNQIITLQIFYRKFISKKNEENWNTYE